MNPITRREHLGFLGALALAGAAHAAPGAGASFSWDLLQARAEALLRAAWRGDPAPDPAAAAIHYEQVARLTFAYDHALGHARDDGYAVGFLPLFNLNPHPVRVHLVDRGRAGPLRFDPAMFARAPGAQGPLPRLPQGFAGLRVMNRGGIGDWLAFAGASYFRSAGPLDQYGLSARGLAVDCGLSTPEEFPVFTDFWLEPGDGALTVYALMESRRTAGAFRFVNRRAQGEIVQEVSARVWLRGDVERLGFAPLTSMFWYGEGNRAQATDWRPEVHDSDGLLMWTGSGERIWRPLVNPPHPLTNVFADLNPKGFGLMQRDRNGEHYQDDGVFYEKRPSLWVEPAAGWGDGAVTLFELPAHRETDDNIVAFWMPKAPARAGSHHALDYRLHWLGGEPAGGRLARVTDLWTGTAGAAAADPVPGGRRIVADFAGPALAGLARDAVEATVEIGRGRLIGATAYPVQGTPARWRLVADVALATDEPTDVRARLSHAGAAVAETLVYQLHANDRR